MCVCSLKQDDGFCSFIDTRNWRLQVVLRTKHKRCNQLTTTTFPLLVMNIIDQYKSHNAKSIIEDLLASHPEIDSTSMPVGVLPGAPADLQLGRPTPGLALCALEKLIVLTTQRANGLVCRCVEIFWSGAGRHKHAETWKLTKA